MVHVKRTLQDAACSSQQSEALFPLVPLTLSPVEKVSICRPTIALGYCHAVQMGLCTLDRQLALELLALKEQSMTCIGDLCRTEVFRINHLYVPIFDVGIARWECVKKEFEASLGFPCRPIEAGVLLIAVFLALPKCDLLDF